MNRTALTITGNDSALVDAFLQNTGDILIYLSSSGGIEKVSEPAAEFFGYTKNELISLHISHLLSDTDLKDIHPSATAAQGCHQVNGRRKDGRPVTVEVIPINVLAITGDGKQLIRIKPLSAKTSLKELAEDGFSALKAAMETVEAGFVLVGPNARILLFNQHAVDSIVLNQQGQTLQTGGLIYDYIRPDRIPVFSNALNKAMTGKRIVYEKDYAEKEGNKWFQFTLSPVWDNGKISGVCITGSDITKLKQAEEEAKRSRQRFKGLVEKSGDVVTILSPSISITYISSSVERVLGYTIDEALEIEFASLVHPDDFTKLADSWQEVAENTGFCSNDHCFRIKHKNGSWRWICGTFTNLVHDESIGGIVHNFRDITEAVEARNDLKASEERYRYIFNNNPEPMWIFDPGTLNFLEVNNAAVEKLGYTREAFLKLSLLDLCDTENANTLWRTVAEIKGKVYNQNGAWKHFTSDRKELYFNISTHNFCYKGTDAILVLANDVTEKCKADQLLIKAFEEKRNILDSITDGFLAVDTEWNITYWNREAHAILGIRREDIVGKNMWEVYNQPLPNRFYTEYSKALTEKVTVHFEEYVQIYNVWLDISVYPSSEGLAIYFRNITEKKLIQEKIRVTMERYEMVAKATNDAIYEWDVVKDVTYWGEGLFTLFGHPRCEDAMSPSTWLDNLHPDEKDSILARAMSLFQVQQKSLTREMRFRCADGSYKIVFDKQNIYYDKNGKPVRVVGAMQDITDRKKSEAAVKDLNLELEKKAEKLKRSNEELERFAYVASHDLQEPLRMVGSFLQLLQKKYRDKLDATAHQYIDFAVDGSVRMKKLINDLLEYARVGTDREAFFKVDMGAVVNDVLRDFKRASENGVFRVGFMPWVKGQKTQLTQVMNNLIGNALKYNKSETPEVEIGCTESDTEWQFYIKDNGIGIEEKYLEKVFVIFQRLHNRSEFPGTGIGLSICRKIVERHGGRIWIESAPDHGSTVFFTIKKLNGRD